MKMRQEWAGEKCASRRSVVVAGAGCVPHRLFDVCDVVRIGTVVAASYLFSILARGVNSTTWRSFTRGFGPGTNQIG